MAYVWRFTFEDNTYSEGEVTLGEWDAIEGELDKPWHKINPLLSAHDARVILRTLVSNRTGTDADTVDKAVAALTTSEFLAMFTEQAEDDLPTEYEDGIPQ